jgi:hypothetical protein
VVAEADFGGQKIRARVAQRPYRILERRHRHRIETGSRENVPGRRGTGCAWNCE